MKQKLEKLFDSKKSLVNSEMNQIMGGAISNSQSGTIDHINCQETKITMENGQSYIIRWEAEQNGY